MNRFFLFIGMILCCTGGAWAEDSETIKTLWHQFFVKGKEWKSDATPVRFEAKPGFGHADEGFRCENSWEGLFAVFYSHSTQRKFIVRYCNGHWNSEIGGIRDEDLPEPLPLSPNFIDSDKVEVIAKRAAKYWNLVACRYSSELFRADGKTPHEKLPAGTCAWGVAMLCDSNTGGYITIDCTTGRVLSKEREDVYE